MTTWTKTTNKSFRIVVIVRKIVIVGKIDVVGKIVVVLLHGLLLYLAGGLSLFLPITYTT
jgi:hypothetical protein